MPSARLGCNRLAIVDEPRARQPVGNEDGTVWAAFNGEIYNFRDLMADLQRRGHRFASESDTEVLVHGYEEWGAQILDRLSGMFALLLWDEKDQTYLAARDPVGIKPLYYADGAGGVRYFSSEIKGLAPLEDVQTIQVVGPGTYVTARGSSSYQWLQRCDLAGMSVEDIADLLRTTVANAVQNHTRTDLPVGVFFGGGIDSTAVLALALDYHRSVTAIIAGRPGAPDRVEAEAYCCEHGVPYRLAEPPEEPELFRTLAKDLVYITESFEPNTVRQSAISYYIAAATADLKVCLCGEGADELFAGYPEMAGLADDPGRLAKITARFLADLHRTQLQRVDRTAMHFTTEVRVPFLDRDVLSVGLAIAPGFKVRRSGADVVSKYILREAMRGVLPERLRLRDKVVLSEGAGFKGNQRVGGLFYDLASREIMPRDLRDLQHDFPEWRIANKEEAFYFREFVRHGFHKAKFAQNRVTVNHTDTLRRPNS